MLRNFLTGFLSVLCSAALMMGAEPEKVVTVKAPGLPGGEAKFPDRNQLRAGPGTKRIALNKQMRAALNSQTIPVPSTWDWTKGNTISFPMLGNDKWGDCYYVAACKIFIAANANATGTKVVFDEAKVIARYRTLSGGDNGLSDDQILPEMLKGVIGPNGPHKILDRAVVSSTDHTALGLCQYAFGPTLFTFAVPEAVMQQVRPGVLWDTQRGNLQTGDGYVGGHAVILTGKNAKANYSLQTWALNPPVEVTPRFMANNDPECITVFTLEWFDAKGYAPNGFHYTTLAPLWTQITGGVLPASPFPPPITPQPPLPPTPPTPPVPPPAPSGADDFSITIGSETIVIQSKSKNVLLPKTWTAGSVRVPAPMADAMELTTYAEVMENVLAGQYVRMYVGVPDPHKGRGAYVLHAGLPSGTKGIKDGQWNCFLWKGEPTMQEEVPYPWRDPMPRAVLSTPLRTTYQNGRMVLQGCVSGFCPPK